MAFTIALAVLAEVAPVRSATMPAPQDLAFATNAARGGVAEIADAKLAFQTSRNQRVDAFAGRMITDHGRANRRLAAIMQRERIAAPAGLGARNQAVNRRLQGLTGSAFDAAYIAAQKSAHKKTIDLFEAEIRNGTDAPLVAFAKGTLPTLKSHLRMLLEGSM